MIAASGDINGDGYSDLAVGAPQWDDVDADEGRVYVYFNRSPTLETVGDQTVLEGKELSLSLDGNDLDSDSLTYEGLGLPTGARVDWRNFSWTPTYSQAGTYEIILKVSDGRSEDTETISIEVMDRAKPGSVTTLSVMKAWGRVKMLGSVTPRHWGHEVSLTLSRKRGGAFRPLDKQVARLSRKGRFESSFDRPRPGRCKVLAVFAGDWNSRASSDRVTFDC